MSADLIQDPSRSKIAEGPAVTQAWQPIKTAPKDGSIVVVKWGQNQFACAYYVAEEALEVDEFDDAVGDYEITDDGRCFLPEGWYEVTHAFEPAYTSCNPKYWAPLPTRTSSLIADPVAETAGG